MGDVNCQITLSSCLQHKMFIPKVWPSNLLSFVLEIWDFKMLKNSLQSFLKIARLKYEF